MAASNLYEYIEQIKKLSPLTLNLITARNDAEFDEALNNWMLQGIEQMERNKKNFNGLDEEGLSAVLALALTTTEVSVTQEENSNGHVDLTIKLNNFVPQRMRLCEAKIWKGKEYHVDGLKQLLSRYITGRECRGFVISYVKQKDIKDLFGKLREYINESKPCDLDKVCKDYNIKWSFLSDHKHNSGELIEVCHLGCNLFIEKE